MPTIVLTPNVTGRDGISMLSRQIVAALGEEKTTVLALHEREVEFRLDRASVHGAAGSSWRFLELAIRKGARCGSDTRVICVHVHLAPALLPFMGRGTKAATILCGIEVWTRLSWARRRALALSDYLLAISAHTVKRFRDRNPQLASLPVAVCHPGVDAPAGRDGPEPDAERPVALIVGRMASDERYKGHDLLLDVWPRVVARVPGAGLRIVGDGGDRARLEARARAAGVSGPVVFTGAVDDERLLQAYRECAVLVMPSANEGFGFVYLEAMRAGRACIGAHGAASEIIVAGETGLLVDAADGDALAEALVRLLGDRRERARMGRAGYARFREHFTTAKFGERLNAIWQA